VLTTGPFQDLGQSCLSGYTSHRRLQGNSCQRLCTFMEEVTAEIIPEIPETDVQKVVKRALALQCLDLKILKAAEKC